MSETNQPVVTKKTSVGSQPIRIDFSVEQVNYEIKSALPTYLEIENISDQPIYLPWGVEPGYILHVVGINSDYRISFSTQLPTPSANIHDYYSISPGDKIMTEFALPALKKSGLYNICAETLILGISDKSKIYSAELNSSNTRICKEITYKLDND
jgi:hypothetical protein